MKAILVLVICVAVVGCGPKKLHVVNPHCETNPETGVTLCIA